MTTGGSCQARTNGNRISVFTAPVLSAEDPTYRGVKIPQEFWKIAAWTTTKGDSTVLHAAGFVLDLGTVRAPARIDSTPPAAWTVPHLPSTHRRHHRPHRAHTSPGST